MADAKSIELRLNKVSQLLYEGKKRKEIVAIMVKSCKISSRIVDDYIKQAKQLVSERNQAEVRVIESNAGTLQVSNTNVLLNVDPKSVCSKIEKRQLVAKIMRGEFTTKRAIIVDAFDKDGEPCKQEIALTVYPTIQDIARATEIDNVMSGDNAPAKFDVRTASMMQIVVTNNTDKARIEKIGKKTGVNSQKRAS